MESCSVVRRAAVPLAVALSVTWMSLPASAAGDERVAAARHRGLTINGQPLSKLLRGTARTPRGISQVDGVVPKPSKIDHRRLEAPRVLSDWSRVPIIASGTKVWVTVRGEKPVLCTFVRADQAVLIVRTGRWQRVERMAQGDVQEIRAGPTRTRRALGLLGGVGGFFGAAWVGGTVGGIGSEPEELGGYVLGALSGGVVGAVFGYKAVTHWKGI